MQIYDVIVAVILLALVVRGWRRGLLREALDVAVLIAGIFLVFRLSPVVGTIISGMANVPYEVARIAAGAGLFLVLVVGSALLSRLLAAMLNLVPGASFFNRFGGGLLGAAYASLIVVLATTLLSAAPMSDGLRSTVDDSIEASAIGAQIVRPAGGVQQAVSAVSGERVVSTVIAIRSAVGDRLAAGTIPIPLPDVGDATLSPSQVSAQEVFDSLNRTRIAEGLDPLGWSSDLAIVAVTRADEVYRSGSLSLDDGLADSLAAQGVPGTINTEMVVLAASPEGLAEAFTATPDYKDAICHRQHRKAGIGVISGPFGLLAVQVLTG